MCQVEFHLHWSWEFCHSSKTISSSSTIKRRPVIIHGKLCDPSLVIAHGDITAHLNKMKSLAIGLKQMVLLELVGQKHQRDSKVGLQTKVQQVCKFICGIYDDIETDVIHHTVNPLNANFKINFP